MQSFFLKSLSSVLACGMASLSPEALEQGCAELNERIDEYEARKTEGLLQALVEWILIFLVRKGFAVKQTYRPEYVGVHPCNRGGTGLVSSAVVALLAFILKNGWSWRAIAKASAVEIPPDDVEIRKFNDRVAATSCGMIAKPTHELKIASLECSHTTASLNCIRTSCIHSCSIIADTNGKLSLARLEERSPEMAKAVREGIEYLVIKHQVAKKVPRLCPLLSKAGNLDHEAYQHETTWQVLFHMHAAAQAPGADWSEICLEIGTQKPSLQPILPSLGKFVEKWSGGEAAPLLHAVDRFAKTLAKVRTLPGVVYASVADLAVAEAPTYIEAIFKAMLNCPAKYLDKVTGVSRLLTSGDIHAIEEKLKPTVLECEALLRTARNIADACREVLDDSLVEKELGELDLHAVMRTHKKDHPIKKFASFNDIGFAFYEALRNAQTDSTRALPVICPWQEPSRTIDKTGRQGIQLRQLAVGGRSLTFASFLDELKSKSIEVGSHVASIKDKAAHQKYEVVKISAEGTQIKLVDGKCSTAPRQINNMLFLDGYKKVGKAEIQWHLLSSLGDAASTKAWRLDEVKSALRFAMVQAWKRMSPKLQIQSSPKSVFAEQYYSAGQLRLVAFSTSLIQYEAKKPGGSVEIAYSEDTGDSLSIKFAIASTLNLDIKNKEKKALFVVPFFIVKRVVDKSEANMTLSTTKETVKVGSRSFSVEVPCLENLVSIGKHVELCVYCKDEIEVAGPPPKRQRH